MNYCYQQLKPNGLDAFESREENTDTRDLYFHSLNFEENIHHIADFWSYPTVEMGKCSDKVLLDDPLFFMTLSSNDYEDSSAIEGLLLKVPSINLSTLSTVDTIEVITQLAPIHRIDGHWISGCISLKDSLHKNGAMLLESYSEMVGNGYLEKSHSHCFDRYLQENNIELSPVYSQSYSSNPNIYQQSFDLASFTLTVSLFPSTLLPETLGVNLFMTLWSYNWFAEEPCKGKNASSFFKLKSESAKNSIKNALACIKNHIDSHANNLNYEEQIARIDKGFSTTLQLANTLVDQINTRINFSRSEYLNNKMLGIFGKVGDKAAGYHKRGSLDGHSLDYWFTDAADDTQALIDALANSRYVTPQKPEKSPFLTHSTSETGPMFRVFTDNELAVITEWISLLPPKNEKTKETPALNRPSLNCPFGPKVIMKNNHINTEIQKIDTLSKQLIKKYSSAALADLYFYLLNYDQHYDVLPYAKHFAEKWLHQHSAGLFTDALKIPFKTYSHDELTQWVEEQHKLQVASYIPLVGEPDIDKESIIESSIHISPLTLIDGAWIRKMVHPVMANSHACCRLYKTYVDELGNGDIKMHHGNIYRNLLESMNVKLPSFTAQSFPRSTVFDKSDLQVPVFWLSISLFPRRFLPEILGLNLAMELSGIGGSYRRSSDILKYYGYSARFNIIHNTVDNIVSGHTAWAIQAIQIHLDEVYQKGGEQSSQKDWYRIWNGYRSLTAPNNKYTNVFKNLKHTFRAFHTTKEKIYE